MYPITRDGQPVNPALRPAKQHRGRKLLWPLDRMMVGDTINVPAEDHERAQSAARSYGQRHNCQFKLRRVDDDGSTRVERIS